MNVLAYVHLRNIYRSTGVGRVAREISEHLAARPDIDLRILADRQDHARVVHKVGVPWTGYTYAFFKDDTSRQQMRWYALDSPKAETYWPEAEIVYCPNESYVPTSRAKLVVTSHDMQLFEPGAHAVDRWLLQQRVKWRLLFRRLEKRAALFHAISAFSAERLEHFFPGTRGRIRVIPNAVSASFLRPPTPQGLEVLETLGLTDGPYLLLPGGLQFRKNAELVLAAWPEIQKQCPDLKLVITSHNAPAFAERASSLPSVVLAGFQEEAALVALYSAAEAVWFPSRYEGFGMPVLEAMACGAPVVCSNATALPEVAGGAAAAMVDPDRRGEHIDAVVGLLQNAEARARASRLGRERARLFTWDRSAQMLVDAFSELV